MEHHTGPHRLSWGNRQSSRHSASGSIRNHQTEGDADVGQTLASSTQHRCCSATLIDYKPDVDQVQRQVLHNLLSAVLQEDRQQLEHYQLTVEAVAAVLHHNISAAVKQAKEEAIVAASASTQQQVATLQREAESQLARAVQDAEARAATSAAQHSREVASLRAQLAAVEKEKRHLFGKSAQKSRVVRQAETAAEDAQAQLEELRQRLSKLNKQLDAKEAAISRIKLAQHQEVAALKGALQEAEAAAVAAAANHCRGLERLRQQHAAQQQQQASTLQEQANLDLLQTREIHQQQLAKHKLQAAAAAADAMQELRCHCQELCQSCHAIAAAVSDDIISDWHKCTADQLNSFHCNLQGLHAELADVRTQAQQLLSLAAAKHSEVQQLQHHHIAIQQQLEQSRSEHAEALEELHSTSTQLAALQPAVVKLQQEKQALSDQLAVATAAADAATQQQQCLQQQLLQVTTQLTLLQQEQGEGQKELADTQAQLQAVQVSQAAGVADHAQQMTRLQQQSQQRCDQLQELHGQQLNQLCQRLQWLCQAYFVASAVHHPDSSGKGTFNMSISDGSSSKSGEGQSSDGAVPHCTSCTSDDGTASPMLQMALERLKQQCQPIIEDQHGGLGSLYDMFQQHKQELSLGINDQEAAAACSWVNAKQQTLQLEACLLHLMLGVQETIHAVSAAVTPHQQSLRQQQQQQLILARPGTSSSRGSEGPWDSACRASSLTGQLLQAMSKERKQLTQEIRKLQSQQQQARQLKHSISSPGTLSSRVRPDVQISWATTQPLPFAMASAAGALAQQQSVTEDVEEVLQLLQSCQLPIQRPVSNVSQWHMSVKASPVALASSSMHKDGTFTAVNATVERSDLTAVDNGRSCLKSSNSNSRHSNPSQRGICGLKHVQHKVWAQMP